MATTPILMYLLFQLAGRNDAISVYQLSNLVLVIIHKTDRCVSKVRIVEYLSQQQLSSVACAIDEHWSRAGKSVGLTDDYCSQQPERQPACAEKNDQQQRINDEYCT